MDDDTQLAGVISFSFHIGGFLKGTLHLDTLEKGAYLMLMIAHYQSGSIGLLDDDKKLSRITGTSMRKWMNIRPVLEEYFEINNGYWVHRKIIKVLQKVHEVSAVQRVKALKRFRHNNEENADLCQKVSDNGYKKLPLTITDENSNPMKSIDSGHATAMPGQCQPITNNQKPNLYIYIPENVSKDVWEDFVILRKSKKAKITKTVVNRLVKEAEKANWSVEEVLKEMCLRNWTGFKAEWVTNGEKYGTKNNYNSNSNKNNQYNKQEASYLDKVKNAGELALTNIREEELSMGSDYPGEQPGGEAD